MQQGKSNAKSSIVIYSYVTFAILGLTLTIRQRQRHHYVVTGEASTDNDCKVLLGTVRQGKI